MAAPRELSRSRLAIFSIVALIFFSVFVELVSGAVLRFVKLSEPRSDVPKWLVSQESGFRTGTYTPDPHVIWKLAPGIRAPTHDDMLWGLGPLETNEHGFRSPSVSRAKPDGVRRAIVVGGSHPMGMFVDEHGTYARALERRLARAGGARWQVINASVAGHTTWQGLQYIRHHGLEFEPDVVVFDLGTNDDLPLAVDFAAPDREVTAVPSWLGRGVRLLEPSAAVHLVRRAILPSRRPAAGASRVSVEEGIENLRAVEELGRRVGFEVLFVQQVTLVHPPGMGRAEVGWTECVRDYDGFAPRVDLCDLFIGLEGDAESYFVDMIHANESGHALIADAMAAKFVEAGWAGP